jgi:hypothetical protein
LLSQPLDDHVRVGEEGVARRDRDDVHVAIEWSLDYVCGIAVDGVNHVPVQGVDTLCHQEIDYVIAFTLRSEKVILGVIANVCGIVLERFHVKPR